MKSWWTVWPVLLLSLIPFLVGLLPTVELKGTYYLGGPIREVGANTLINILPPEASNRIAHFFVNGNLLHEYFCYLPLASLIFIFMLWSLFLIISMFIKISNWYRKRQENSLRNALRG